MYGWWRRVSLFLTVCGTKQCNHSLAPWPVFFDWDQLSNSEQPSDKKVANEQCTGLLSRETVRWNRLGCGRSKSVFSLSGRVALQSKLKWRCVRLASACGCVITMWDMQAGTTDPRELSTAFAIRPCFFVVIGLILFRV